MLMIRLQRVGRKHETAFRLVLTDKQNSTKSGRYLKVLGSYDPRKKTEHFDNEGIKKALAHGAKLSITANNLLIENKVIEGTKINAQPRRTPKEKKAK